ncbi:hypothetical protein GB937_009519 [Aspergillus fischeri]|nr:hypothetical protein GB937_009519 [Aspergillus fischeri]
MSSNFLTVRQPTSKVAFVAGANGISGGAIIEHLIKLPCSEWSEIIVTSRKLLKSNHSDSRVRFIALDFLEPVKDIVEKMREHCTDVTHAFFTSYIHDNDFSKLHEKNCPLFRNFLESIDLACLKLKRVHYGFQFRDITTPLMEQLPRYEGPHNIFYYEQEDDLFAIQKRHQTWQYNIIRPWAIIGYSCQYLGINETLTIAQYFLICRELGETPKWPGDLSSFHRVENQSYAPSIADLTLWAATQDHCKNETFNHVNGDVIVWKYLWHLLAEYFKVPMDQFEPPNESTVPMDMSEWAKDKQPVWETIVAKYGGDPKAFQPDAFALMNWYITPTEQKAPFIASISKARAFGWSRYDDTYRAWLNSFRSYENAGVLPVP